VCAARWRRSRSTRSSSSRVARPASSSGGPSTYPSRSVPGPYHRRQHRTPLTVSLFPAHSSSSRPRATTLQNQGHRSGNRQHLENADLGQWMTVILLINNMFQPFSCHHKVATLLQTPPLSKSGAPFRLSVAHTATQSCGRCHGGIACWCLWSSDPHKHPLFLPRPLPWISGAPFRIPVVYTAIAWRGRCHGGIACWCSWTGPKPCSSAETLRDSPTCPSWALEGYAKNLPPRGPGGRRAPC
jgi:hypothetical protein